MFNFNNKGARKVLSVVIIVVVVVTMVGTMIMGALVR